MRRSFTVSGGQKEEVNAGFEGMKINDFDELDFKDKYLYNHNL